MRILFLALFLCLILPVYSDSRLGADLAEPMAAKLLDTFSIPEGSMHTFSAEETREMINLAADIHINVFELIDCIFRYIKPKNIRVSMSGDYIRNLQTDFDLGGDRVIAILCLDKLRYLETGARLSPGQTDLDIFLDSPAEKYIEIGTAFYETRFGFEKMAPNLFDNAYGITVKKLFITTPLTKLDLWAPGKGAIYTKAISRPKKWNLDVVTKKKNNG
ncbi:hypothetical protein K7I13_01620 [Brucepastera parasyntrophica]|uniref:hypothetical protein n=1 Tax=Brucepastera parasyntrophica TaxID=2880008 RepID=UPI00210952DB|nr:hypothetical protein [Brucepastera parasyntrophica]ULQ60056.1 hypothetical protein K7I13_01620 [Brucepastera parasyntrophica]